MKSLVNDNQLIMDSDKSKLEVDNLLYGKVCVITGTLEYLFRREAMQIIADIGGINADNVTKKTNYLILGNFEYNSILKGEKSLKLKKAEKYILEGQDLKILSENVFYDLIDEYE
ncbi:BRCT domain-containing protein [Facklamia sp. HMSC062C11]|uniref:BRCT domain-containing protein n=1 Tax=Facklamia sp. HMSC062C11 TaxID=1739262 RepID=UPI0014392417|nr:BRCT domain-containing protein [Facklamia sp. HMSC062C11]